MEGSVIDLSGYRLARAKEDLATAKKNCVDGSYRASVNRSNAVDADDAEVIVNAVESYLANRYDLIRNQK